MKKTYMAPRMEQMVMKDVMPLCASGSNEIQDKGLDEQILFGGKDNGGVLDPSAKLFPDFGDDLNGLLW